MLYYPSNKIQILFNFFEEIPKDVKRLYSSCILLVAALCLSAVSINASELCKSYNKNWKKSFSDLREKTIEAASSLEVVSVNGGISVKGESRSDILVRACVRTWAESKSEAKRMADGIRIEMGQKIFVTNTPKRDWSVSFDIIAPKSTGLNLKTKNGRIKIESINGDLDFETTNGNMRLNDVSGSLKVYYKWKHQNKTTREQSKGRQSGRRNHKWYYKAYSVAKLCCKY